MLARLLAAVLLLCLVPAAHAQYARVAWSCDGNYHDKDDWGASAMALALAGDAGYQGRLTHYDYNCHFPESIANWERQMTTSVQGAYNRWQHFAPVFNDRIARDASVNSLAGQISASHAANKLVICAAGPMEIIWRALGQSNRAVHGYVTILSHSSNYNETDGVYDLARIRNNFPAVKVLRIPNQNQRLNTKQNWGPWTWLRDSREERLRFLWDRMRASGRADVSDSGLMYYVIYGNPTPAPTDLRRVLTQ